MGCSSFCEFTVKLKNKKKIQWKGQDGASPLFYVPKQAEEHLKAIHSVDDLINFVQLCIAADGISEAKAKEIYSRKCGQFDKQLKTIGQVEDLSEISMAWGQFDPSDGYPEEACSGQSLAYAFQTGKCKVSYQADQDFIDEMYDVYGDMFEE